MGTLVTSETFEAWRVNFMKGVDANREAFLAAERAARKGRLTGRQLFERDASLRTSDIKEVAPGEVFARCFLVLVQTVISARLPSHSSGCRRGGGGRVPL